MEKVGLYTGLSATWCSISNASCLSSGRSIGTLVGKAPATWCALHGQVMFLQGKMH